MKKMNDLEIFVTRFLVKKDGWKIVSFTPERAILSRKKGMGTLGIIAGIVGLFFWIIPGILIFIFAALLREEESMTVTLEQATIAMKVMRAKRDAKAAARSS